MIWLAAPILAVLCFLAYSFGIVPASLGDLSLVEARIVAAPTPLDSHDRPRFAGPYIRLTLSSSQNLIAKARNSELNTYSMIADCADPDSTIFGYGPYYRGLHTANYTDRDNPRFEALRRERADSYDYQVFVPTHGRLRAESDFNRPMPDYDLEQERRTLCIRIGGGNMIGGYFRSNIVRLATPLPGAAE